MKIALKMLGYDAYHPGTIFYTQIRDTDMWREALEAKYQGKGKPFTRNEWDQLLGRWDATSGDAPICCFAEELIQAYPEAKVIIVERDVDRWFKSYNDGLISQIYSPLTQLIARLDPEFVGRMGDCCAAWCVGWMQANNANEHRRNARRVYKEHYQLVRRVTPPERLLDFQLAQGWEPLCKFLNKPVPDTPFPHVNDGEDLQDMIAIVMKRGFIRFLRHSIRLAVPLGMVLFAWVVFFR